MNYTPTQHEVLCRQIAQEMARQVYPTAYDKRLRSIKDWNYWVIKEDSYLPAARIAVKHMADMFWEGVYSSERTRIGVESQAASLGLIIPTDHREGAGMKQ